jgi:3D (Asp-Asp-Asp) domain-containing protein
VSKPLTFPYTCWLMRAPLAFLLPAFLVLSACVGSPPQKELDRAQGAIDAARAAGAEVYARESFTAATSALQQANDAVAQSDNRLALTRALDAYDRAQEAARGAADGKARVRSEAEAALTAATAAVHRLNTRVTVESSRVPKGELPAARKAHAAAEAELQKARASLSTGAYLEARDAARALTAEINERFRALDAAAPKTAKPTRRRS